MDIKYGKVIWQREVVLIMAKEDKVILTCTVCLSRNYTTYKNKKVHNERLELKKYCKKCNEHTIHKETK